MKRPRLLAFRSLLLVAGLGLAACTPGPRPLPAPSPAATLIGVSQEAATATPTQVPATATAAPAMPALAPATPTAAPATAVPATVATQAAPPSASNGDEGGITTPEPAPLPAGDLPAPGPTITATFVPSKDPSPLQIEVMRRASYPGSAITVEQNLAPGPNYTQAVVSYRSDGYKIYALMTVPTGEKPATGWPVIVFNHGFIQPAVYRTTERYVAYVDAIARAGYIVFKSDYRGHGSSEGPTTGGGYYAPGYTDDVLNAVASLKAFKDADPNRIGMWGHSMGGQVTLRAMVVSKDIKAGVIWGGVVAPYPNIFARANYNERAPFNTRPGATPAPGPGGAFGGRGGARDLIAKYGTSDQNPPFWSSISPNSYLADLSGPIQLDHSVTDEEVPVAASKTLYQELQAAGKTAELYTYPGDNHNISANFATAMARSIAFFDKYVKGS